MKYLFTWAALLFFSTGLAASQANRPQEPKEPFPYTAEEVTFFNPEDSIRLAGTLTLPKKMKGKKKFPAVVLVTGSGAQNRDEEIMGHKPFWVIADHLSRNGIAVLRFDDRGVGQSEGKFAQATTKDFAKDAEAAINYLKTRKEIDPAKIGVAGHSEGGSVAFILGGKGIPAFIISLAGPGVNGKKLLELQREALFRAAGVPEEYIRQYNELMEKATRIAFEAKDIEELRSGLTETFQGTILQSQTNLAVLQFSSPGLLAMLRFDPAEDFAKISVPVWAVNGSKDLQVPAKVNLEAIQKGIMANGNRQITIREYPELNHLFQTAKTGLPKEYAQIEETFNPLVLKEMTDWLLKIVAQ